MTKEAQVGRGSPSQGTAKTVGHAQKLRGKRGFYAESLREGMALWTSSFWASAGRITIE